MKKDNFYYWKKSKILKVPSNANLKKYRKPQKVPQTSKSNANLKKYCKPKKLPQTSKGTVNLKMYR